MYYPGFGGVVSAELEASLDVTRDFVSNLKLFKLGESLGGVKSLVCHPPSMTHAAIPAVERAKLGLSDSLVRFSVGIEDVRDLTDDVVHGLATISGPWKKTEPSLTCLA